jgi:hypothetical protein
MFINGHRVEKIYKAKNGATSLTWCCLTAACPVARRPQPLSTDRNRTRWVKRAATEKRSTYWLMSFRSRGSQSLGIIYIIDGDLHRETYPFTFTRGGKPTIADALDFLNQDYFYPLSSIFGATSDSERMGLLFILFFSNVTCRLSLRSRLLSTQTASYVARSQLETGADVRIFFELTKRQRRFLVLLPSNPFILKVCSYHTFSSAF